MKCLLDYVGTIRPCGMTNLLVNGYAFKWGDWGWEFVDSKVLGWIADDSSLSVDFDGVW